MTESRNGATIRSPMDAPLIDQWGNEWKLTVRRQISIDGITDPATQNVQELVYINRRFWQFNGDRWWAKDNVMSSWQPPGGTTNAPFGPDPDPRIDQLSATLTAWISEAGRILIGIKNDLIAIKLAQSDGDLHTARSLADIIELLTVDRVATSARLSVPTHLRLITGEPFPMALNIIDDAISVIPIVFTNRAMGVTAKPAGSTDTVAIDNTANFSVAMSADGMSVEVTPVQPPVDGATGNLTYTNSGVATQSAPLALVITADATAASDHFDDLHVTTIPLPAAPPAPAPAP